MMRRSLFPLFVLAFLLFACQSRSVQNTAEKVNVDGGSYTNLKVEELHNMLQDKDFVFVNVHIPFEGNVAETDLSIPYNEISDPKNLSQLPTDKNAKIVLYCRSGRMSEMAAETLVKLGYNNIWNLDGGMVAWEQAGYPLLDQ
jgi:rhodanese-related sulfurtransferase